MSIVVAFSKQSASYIDREALRQRIRESANGRWAWDVGEAEESLEPPWIPLDGALLLGAVDGLLEESPNTARTGISVIKGKFSSERLPAWSPNSFPPDVGSGEVGSASNRA
jgi:hypothetical protein